VVLAASAAVQELQAASLFLSCYFGLGAEETNLSSLHYTTKAGQAHQLF
jgi:hypothetical protein